MDFSPSGGSAAGEEAESPIHVSWIDTRVIIYKRAGSDEKSAGQRLITFAHHLPRLVGLIGLRESGLDPPAGENHPAEAVQRRGHIRRTGRIGARKGYTNTAGIRVYEAPMRRSSAVAVNWPSGL
ncbi:MAG: hypothetical protein HBSAPP02_13530 [Phycisphaerae bacterium]|nr:MAG: hypothetical protein HRU71_08060 [Planctomycetia bacterium]RIK70638.1 MAG: hypothetical protein DCC66_04995 [Planctomycetota bacterium]GJQ26321.1 MAG: hypothetical protein HBSAPP02_13530 [Phycisphaerae bacterium]